MPTPRRCTADARSRPTTVAAAIQTPAESPNASPIPPADRPLPASASGRSRPETPPTTPSSALTSAAPAIARLRRTRPKRGAQAQALEPLAGRARRGVAGDERDQRQRRDGEHRRGDAPAGGVGDHAGDDRADEPADARRRDQRPRPTCAAAAGRRPGGADHPEDPEAEAEEQARREQQPRGCRRAPGRRARAASGPPRASSGTRVPKRFAAYPIGIAATSIASVVVVSRRPVSTEERPRSCWTDGSTGTSDDSATPLTNAKASRTRSSRSKRCMPSISSQPTDS